MSHAPRFLIIDGYPKPSRDQFDQVGMTLACTLYENMLRRFLPDAETRIWLAADSAQLPDDAGAGDYAGILWTGCNLTVYHDHDERVTRQVALAKRAYELGTPGFGSCWGLQMAAFAAGGKVEPSPVGREMGLARKIHLTEEGQKHPMMQGRRLAYEAFISHDDRVTQLPDGAAWLASNEFTRVQALAVTHKKGTFWATQYHPEYTLKDVSALVRAREEKLLRENFFADAAAVSRYADALAALAAAPDRKDLRWQLAIDDDVLDEDRRQIEFAQWIEHIIKPRIQV